jgi:hypothetical protein
MTRQCSQASSSSEVNLVNILLEREEGTLDILMRLRVLDDTISKRDAAEICQPSTASKIPRPDREE